MGKRQRQLVGSGSGSGSASGASPALGQSKRARLGASARRMQHEARMSEALRRAPATLWNPTLMRALVLFQRAAAKARAHTDADSMHDGDESVSSGSGSGPGSDSDPDSQSRRTRTRTRTRINGGQRPKARGRSATSASEAQKRLLRERLTHLGLAQVVMEGDGACQFRSVAHELFGCAARHPEVRNAAVLHIEAHPAQFRALFDSERDFARYLTRMRRPRQWGDELTLRAIVDALGIEVHVLTSTEGFGGTYLQYVPAAAVAVTQPEPIRRPTPPVVRRVFLAYLSPCHYNVLTLAEDDERRRAAHHAMQWFRDSQ